MTFVALSSLGIYHSMCKLHMENKNVVSLSVEEAADCPPRPMGFGEVS